MQVAPEADHLLLQKRHYGLDTQEVYHVRLRPVLVCELEMLILVPIEQKVTCFFGRADRSRGMGWYARLVKSNTIRPNVEFSAGEKYKPKAGNEFFSSFGSSSIVVTQILHLRKGE